MMKELCFIIDQMSREKGIPRETLISTLESALLSAARKRFGGGPHPVAMAKALRAIVHENVSVKQAHEIFNQTKRSKPAAKA